MATLTRKPTKKKYVSLPKKPEEQNFHETFQTIQDLKKRTSDIQKHLKKFQSQPDADDQQILFPASTEATPEYLGRFQQQKKQQRAHRGLRKLFGTDQHQSTPPTSKMTRQQAFKILKPQPGQQKPRTVQQQRKRVYPILPPSPVFAKKAPSKPSAVSQQRKRQVVEPFAPQGQQQTKSTIVVHVVEPSAPSIQHQTPPPSYQQVFQRTKKGMRTTQQIFIQKDTPIKNSKITKALVGRQRTLSKSTLQKDPVLIGSLGRWHKLYDFVMFWKTIRMMTRQSGSGFFSTGFDLDQPSTNLMEYLQTGEEHLLDKVLKEVYDKEVKPRIREMFKLKWQTFKVAAKSLLSTTQTIPRKDPTCSIYEEYLSNIQILMIRWKAKKRTNTFIGITDENHCLEMLANIGSDTRNVWTSKGCENLTLTLQELLESELSELQYIRSLTINQVNEFTKEEAKRFHKNFVSMKNLAFLKMSNIGERAFIIIVNPLHAFPKLTRLDLSHNNLGNRYPELANAFSRLKQLTSLNLSHNKLSDMYAIEFAPSLYLLKQLTSLDLSGNNIGDEGAKAIADALPHLPQLTSLNLRSNRIGVEGAKAIAEALYRLPKLIKLSLHGNFIGEEGTKAIAKALPHLPQLTNLDVKYE